MLREALEHGLDPETAGDDAETPRNAHELVDANWTAVRTGVPATVLAAITGPGRVVR